MVIAEKNAVRIADAGAAATLTVGCRRLSLGSFA